MNRFYFFIHSLAWSFLVRTATALLQVPLPSDRTIHLPLVASLPAVVQDSTARGVFVRHRLAISLPT